MLALQYILQLYITPFLHSYPIYLKVHYYSLISLRVFEVVTLQKAFNVRTEFQRAFLVCLRDH